MLDTRVRRSDTVARTGGDEFSIILEEPSRREDAELVAESLGHMLLEPFEVLGRRIRIGASIGIAVFPENAIDADSLCIEADMRMYEVKQFNREAAARLSEAAPDVRKRQAVAS
jgi:diguanylate cyclase (GGDEF)-like protein